MSIPESGTTELKQQERAAMEGRLRDLHKQIEQADKAAQLLDGVGLVGPLDLVQRARADLQRQAAALESGQWTPPKPVLYRRSYLVTVLSQDDVEYDSLKDIAEDIITGDSTGDWELITLEGLDLEQAREAVEAVGSDPGFFQLGEEDKAQGDEQRPS